MAGPDSDDEEPVPSLAAGTVIGGKYRIEKLIGRGGMGSVWSAVHTTLGQRVAVKLIAKRYAASREARHRFDLEAKAVAQLRSRYVVQVYDHGETPDGTPYIVMELLEGESLDARLSRGPLPLAAAWPILEQISRALGRAHALGMVHRDLKPENVFLTTSPDGDGEIAKVLDFGIVKIRGHEGIGSSTRTGAVLGTPLYMSPEQARGLKTVDHRTDIYSLGMVACAMLTGQPAFSGESLGDLLVAICTEPLPQLRAKAAWLPPAMDAWFQRACAREPADRFASIEEMVAAFAEAGGLRAPGVALAQTTGAKAAVASGVAPSPQPSPVGTAAPAESADLTAAPFSVTEQHIPKSGLVAPIAAIAFVVVLGATIVVTRLGRSTDTSGAAAASAAALPVEPMPAAVKEPAAEVVASASVSEPKVAAPKESAPKPVEAPKPVAAKPATPAVKPAVETKPAATAPKPAVPPPQKPAAPAVKPAGKPGNVDLGF